ncbi:TPM domain-containing protein [Rhodoligotrophos defluvii]|uniref:TPM domain-containing protein n=1 Tax=Rhodoligotrophos defluvii TaxID=2561934 RepID=UPI0010C9A908|nr:TPM domain-containing protein [Rhodoligotrophos defluvii]
MSDSSIGRGGARVPAVWRATAYFVAWVFATSLWLTLCYAAPNFPPLTGRVVDQTGMLTPDQAAAISSRLEALEQKTGVQLVVAVIKSLDGYDIRDYGYQLGRYWQLGQKDKNNGVLLLIVPSQNQVSIEVGYGLEGVLTDATSRVIIENAIVPAFRQGQFAQGINAAVTDIGSIVQGDTPPSAAAAPVQDDRDFGMDDLIPLLFMLFVAIMIIRASRGSRGGRGGNFPVIFIPGGFGGGFGGGGFGGGGFSGGGGSFGGGGASGRW